MIKKSLLILISLFAFVSCSEVITSPEKELIEKYGIDISQNDTVISQKIEQNLKDYFAKEGSYRVILTGTPKDYTQTSVNKSLYILTLEAAAKLNITMNIELDLRNINFQDGAIKENMFYGFIDKYKNIVISFIFPDNKITTIEKSAFLGLYNTKEITLPDSVITIKGSVFMESSSIERVTLGNSLREIGELVFMGVDNLKEIIIPDSVKTIGNEAFYLSGLETLKLPSSLESIGDDAFASCHIKELKIPASVKSIGSTAFGSCKELTVVYYLGTSPNYISHSGNAFVNCTKLDTLMLPNAKFINDPAWKTFLGGNFTYIYN